MRLSPQCNKRILTGLPTRGLVSRINLQPIAMVVKVSMFSMVVAVIVALIGVYVAIKLAGLVAKLAIIVLLVLMVVWRLGPAVGIHLPF